MPQPPETVLVAITFDDGSVGIMQFVTRGYLKDGTTHFARVATKQSVDEEIARSAFDHTVVSWRFADRSELPEGEGRDYRNAWRDDGEKLGVDMPKARDLHRQKLRELRSPLFAKNDVALRDAMLAKDTAAIAAAQATVQALRDVTDDPRIEAASTLDELKAVFPDVLKG